MEYNQAYERVNQLKKFYKSLLWFGIIAVFVLGNKFFKNGEIEISFFSGSIFLMVWAIILTVKAVKLFIFNSEWERKTLEEELKKDKKPLNF